MDIPSLSNEIDNISQFLGENHISILSDTFIRFELTGKAMKIELFLNVH